MSPGHGSASCAAAALRMADGWAASSCAGERVAACQPQYSLPEHRLVCFTLSSAAGGSHSCVPTVEDASLCGCKYCQRRACAVLYNSRPAAAGRHSRAVCAEAWDVAVGAVAHARGWRVHKKWRWCKRDMDSTGKALKQEGGRDWWAVEYTEAGAGLPRSMAEGRRPACSAGRQRRALRRLCVRVWLVQESKTGGGRMQADPNRWSAFC